ncbi:MAG: 2Fe-2S iron-sulfur cluster-binding protein [Spirochaetota bacterium]
MAQLVSFKIDGKECMAEEGEYLVAAAKHNHVYIPTLCNYEGVAPQGSCRVCTVNVNGKPMTACTTRVANGMEVENATEELIELRRSIVELLLAEGNHLCPACEQSGNCELQALAYRLRVMAPRFPFLYPKRDVEASNPKLLKDHNRCILCKRCIRAIRDEQGRRLFAFGRRGRDIVISIDTRLAQNITDELADRAAEVCPVGAIVRKERGFATPVGQRTYDRAPIGAEVEQGE